MSKTFILFCVLIGTVYGADNSSFVTFPYSKNPCSCVLLTCTCCSGVQVTSVGFSKKVCVVLKVVLLPTALEATIQLDSKTLAQFSFSAKNPPTYCIPIVLPVDVSMCLKIHDIKLVGLLGVQACMTMYAAYEGSNVFVLPFNCIKISSGSIQYVAGTS